MHILLGLFIAAALVYFWARGFLIVAIMGTLATVPLFVIALENRALEGLVISSAALAIVWAPRYLRQRAARPLMRPLAEVEREHVLAVLDTCGGNQAEAARVLGLARNTLWRRLRAYGTESRRT